MTGTVYNKTGKHMCDEKLLKTKILLPEYYKLMRQILERIEHKDVNQPKNVSVI